MPASVLNVFYLSPSVIESLPSLLQFSAEDNATRNTTLNVLPPSLPPLLKIQSYRLALKSHPFSSEDWDPPEAKQTKKRLFFISTAWTASTSVLLRTWVELEMWERVCVWVRKWEREGGRENSAAETCVGGRRGRPASAAPAEKSPHRRRKKNRWACSQRGGAAWRNWRPLSEFLFRYFFRKISFLL